jgi:hypothetical protein
MGYIFGTNHCRTCRHLSALRQGGEALNLCLGFPLSVSKVKNPSLIFDARSELSNLSLQKALLNS